MKKINIFILLLALCLVFASCRGEGGEDSTALPTVTDSPTGTASEETTSEPEATACTHPTMITLEVVPKCTEDYYIESHCAICDYTKRDLMPPYGHRFEGGVCKICGAADESAETTAHVHELVTTENAPTCTEGATVISSCACGYTSKQEIPPLGHEYKDGVCIRCTDTEAAYGSQGLEYRIDGDHAVLVGIGTCTDTDIVIASAFGGVPVTQIGSGAFISNRFIVTVTLPDGIVRIDEHAFDGCSVLKAVTCPDGLISVGKMAFANCGALTEVKLGSSLQMIEYQAFANCEKLKSIDFPLTLREIGAWAFMGCGSIESVTLGDSIKKIGEYAFATCKSLVKFNYKGTRAEWKNVSIGKEYSSLCPFTVISCSDGIIDLNAPPEQNGSEGLVYVISKDRKSASLVSLGTCRDSEIVIASTYDGIPVTTIAEGALAGNPDLKGIYIPASITVFSGLFSDGRDLQSVTVASDHPTLYSEGNCIIEKNKTLFFACNSSVIPTDGSILRIGASSFSGCSFTEITIPEGVEIIHDSAFDNCEDLISVKLPASLEKLNSAFNGCTSLKYIDFPQEMLWLGGFSGCTSLVRLELPRSGKLSSGAFVGCTSLEEITVPSGTKSINRHFEGCTSLVSVTLPNSVTNITATAFKGCTSLSELIFDGTVAQWNAVQKEDGWEKDCLITAVRCSDGEIALGYGEISNLPEAYRNILSGGAKFVFESKEILLDEFRFPYNGTPITLCGNVKYSVIDMDGDGKVEVVITGDVGDMLVLHEHKGTVYGFDFTFRNMSRIKTDGTFEWNDMTAEGLSYGDSRLYFSKDKYSILEICAVKGDGTENVQYFVDGSLSYLERYLTTTEMLSKEEVSWFPLDRYQAAS